MKKYIKNIDDICSKISLCFLWVYQKTISPDHSFIGKLFPYWGCRFYPSCSEYAKISIKKYGFFSSFFPIINRVIRCNPKNEGGLDFPDKKNKF